VPGGGHLVVAPEHRLGGGRDLGVAVGVVGEQPGGRTQGRGQRPHLGGVAEEDGGTSGQDGADGGVEAHGHHQAAGPDLGQYAVEVGDRGRDRGGQVIGHQLVVAVVAAGLEGDEVQREPGGGGEPVEAGGHGADPG